MEPESIRTGLFFFPEEAAEHLRGEMFTADAGIPSRTDAGIFLHGICGVFALALHDKFGYPIEHIVAPMEPEEEYEGDSEDNAPVNSLVHIYCVQDDVLLDVRGATDNEPLFMSEFSDWVDGNESYFSFDAGDCREFVESSMTAQEYAAYYNAAIEMIERHPDWYQLP